MADAKLSSTPASIMADVMSINLLPIPTAWFVRPYGAGYLLALQAVAKKQSDE